MPTLQGGRFLEALETSATGCSMEWNVDLRFNDMLGLPFSPVLADILRFHQYSPKHGEGPSREYPPCLRKLFWLVRCCAYAHPIPYYKELCSRRGSPTGLKDPELMALVVDQEGFSGRLARWVTKS